MLAEVLAALFGCVSPATFLAAPNPPVIGAILFLWSSNQLLPTLALEG